MAAPGLPRTQTRRPFLCGRPSPDASCNLPGRLAWKPAKARASRRPYSVLLPVGFAVPVPLPGPRWALTPPFHPCRPLDLRRCRTMSRPAVCFLWHFPWGRPRRALPGTVFPWSPDFPLRRPFDRCRSGRPAGWRANCADGGSAGQPPIAKRHRGFAVAGAIAESDAADGGTAVSPEPSIAGRGRRTGGSSRCGGWRGGRPDI